MKLWDTYSISIKIGNSVSLVQGWQDEKQRMLEGTLQYVRIATLSCSNIQNHSTYDDVISLTFHEVNPGGSSEHH